MTMDSGEYGEEQDGNWLSTNGNSFSHCYSSGNFGGAWMITVNCQGTLVPATWVRADKTEGSIMGGQSETITLTFNSIGLEQGGYGAMLILNTNDLELPHIEIPVRLDANYDAIAENNTDAYEIYPNPATTSVTLKGENLSHVAIYNVAGQLVRVVRLDSVVNTIDMNVEAGVYFFNVYDNNGTSMVSRVVITK